MAELLSVRDLTVEFATDRGPAQVLDRISLDIGRGEVVGLVGESGCGKTTLGRAILGVLPQSGGVVRRGEIRFKGRDLLAEDAAAVNDQVRGRSITFIPQDPWSSLSPLFTVGVQVMDLMKWKSPRRDERRREERLAGARQSLPAGAAAGRPRRRAGDAAGRADPRARARARAAAPRVLRRSAPAADDRDGAPAAPRPDHRRRADDGARRDDPGADPAPPPRPREGARRVGAVHHPRSRHRPRDLRPRGGHVRRAGDGVGADRGLLPPARASVHAPPPREPARGGPRAPRHPRRGAEPGRRRRRDAAFTRAATTPPRSAAASAPAAEPAGGEHRVRCYHPLAAP